MSTRTKERKRAKVRTPARRPQNVAKIQAALARNAGVSPPVANVVWKCMDSDYGGTCGYLVTEGDDLNTPIAYISDETRMDDSAYADAEEIAAHPTQVKPLAIAGKAVDLTPFGRLESTLQTPGFVYGLWAAVATGSGSCKGDFRQPNPYCPVRRAAWERFEEPIASPIIVTTRTMKRVAAIQRAMNVVKDIDLTIDDLLNAPCNKPSPGDVPFLLFLDPQTVDAQRWMATHHDTEGGKFRPLADHFVESLKAFTDGPPGMVPLGDDLAAW